MSNERSTMGEFSRNWCFGLLPALVATAALTFSLMSSFWCQAYNFDSDNKRWPNWQFGLWNYRETSLDENNIVVVSPESTGIFKLDQGQCGAYPSTMDIDGHWQAARIFSIVSAALGAVFCIFLWLSPCIFPMQPKSWRTMAIMIIVVMPLVQSLTFLIFRSDVCKKDDRSILLDNLNDGEVLALQGYSSGACRLDEGGIINCVGIGLWVVVGLFMLVTKPPMQRIRDRKHRNPEDVDQTSINSKDSDHVKEVKFTDKSAEIINDALVSRRNTSSEFNVSPSINDMSSSTPDSDNNSKPSFIVILDENDNHSKLQNDSTQFFDAPIDSPTITTGTLATKSTEFHTPLTGEIKKAPQDGLLHDDDEIIKIEEEPRNEQV